MTCWTRLRRAVGAAKFKVGVAFWIFGVCNNFAYVIMLSAANDILDTKSPNATVAPPTMAPNNSDILTTPSSHSTKRNLDCNLIGTGAILLADVLPTLFVKLTAPGFVQKINFTVKIVLVAVLAVVSFIVVGFSQAIWVSLLGVMSASFSSGLGEITFLSLTASYEESSLSGWSSGTGGAGVLGALSYLGLTMVVSPRTTIFIMCVVPALLLLTYFFMLPPTCQERRTDASQQPLIDPNAVQEGEVSRLETDDPLNTDEEKEGNIIVEGQSTTEVEQMEPDWRTKLSLIKPMLVFMIPLSFVYFFEYLINQAFHELLYFPHAFITHREQYRWYQTIYQVGVFISRSSLCLFTFRHIWILSILQGVNVVLLLNQVIFFYIPSIFIVFVIILYEGLLGGLAYVNTFHFILQLPNPQYAEYRMGFASVADSFGITLSGVLAVPLHNYLCSTV